MIHPEKPTHSNRVVTESAYGEQSVKRARMAGQPWYNIFRMRFITNEES